MTLVFLIFNLIRCGIILGDGSFIAMGMLYEVMGAGSVVLEPWCYQHLIFGSSFRIERTACALKREDFDICYYQMKKHSKSKNKS